MEVNDILCAPKIYLSGSSIIEYLTYTLDPKHVIDHEFLDYILDVTLCSEFISNLPNNIHSQLGEAGSLISGGQAQRLAIAKELYLKKPLLILDESTSALDQFTSKLLIGNIIRMCNPPTLLMVTHNQEIVDLFDVELTLDNGVISESTIN